MKVILSIKPKFAKKIFEGTKKFEFRRSIFKKKGIKKIVVYASAPISKVVGEFEIDKIIHEDVCVLWAITRLNAGITPEFFDRYFEGKEKGYAIKVKNPKRYARRYDIKEKYGIGAPQSFAYVE